MIRRNINNYELFADQTLNSILGTNGSYEREFYDLIRSAFIKYSLQASMYSFTFLNHSNKNNRNGKYGWYISCIS